MFAQPIHECRFSTADRSGDPDSKRFAFPVNARVLHIILVVMVVLTTDTHGMLLKTKSTAEPSGELRQVRKSIIHHWRGLRTFPGQPGYPGWLSYESCQPC